MPQWLRVWHRILVKLPSANDTLRIVDIWLLRDRIRLGQLSKALRLLFNIWHALICCGELRLNLVLVLLRG